MKTRFTAAAAMVLLILMLAVPVFASPPVAGNGFFFPISEPVVTDLRTANGNSFITQTVVYQLVGVTNGIYTQVERVKVEANGQALVQASGVCNPCTIEGRSGIVYFRVIGHKDNIGQVIVIGGMGDLANLRGQGTFDGNTGSYVLNLHFD